MLQPLIPGELWTYIVLYFSIIILGNSVTLSAFLLAFLGGLGPWGMLSVTITTILADLTGDTFWFTLGRKLHGTKFGNLIKNHLPHHELIHKHVDKDSLKWLYVSKFLSSFTAPFLFLVGWSQKVEYDHFFKAVYKTTAFWIFVLITTSTVIGSGLLPFVTIKSFRKLEIVITTIVVLTIALEILMKYLSKKPAIKNFFKKAFGLANGNGHDIENTLTK